MHEEARGQGGKRQGTREMRGPACSQVLMRDLCAINAQCPLDGARSVYKKDFMACGPWSVGPCAPACGPVGPGPQARGPLPVGLKTWAHGPGPVGWGPGPWPVGPARKPKLSKENWGTHGARRHHSTILNAQCESVRQLP